MNEENQDTTTVNSPKKKGGKAKKIIIAVVAIILIAAIVVGILFATGVLDLNLSKKSKMIAGVDQLIESYQTPISSISETAEKNGNLVKVLDNFSKDSGIAVKTEISGQIDSLDINSASYSEQETIDNLKELINETKIGADIRYDGNESVYIGIDGEIEDAAISAEAVYDGTQIGVRSEEINSKWLTISESEIEDLASESGTDLEDTKEIISNAMQEILDSIESANVDEKTQEEIQKKYEDVLKDYINDKSKDITSEKTKVKIDGKDKSCQKLTLKLKEKDLKALAVNYIETFQNDKTTQDIIKKSLSSLSTIEEYADADISEEFDDMLDELDYLKDEITDLDLDATLTLTVYSTNTQVYRTDVQIESEGTVITLETTFNKNETVTEVKVKTSGVSMDVGTITLKNDGDNISLKIEASEDLTDMIGVDGLSAEISYKSEKSKSETAISVNAGSYGEGTVKLVTNVNKNEDEEYDEKSTIDIDINMPRYITAKMSFDIQTNIKVSDITIPTVSGMDAIDINDENAIAEYVEEAQTNLTELIEKLKGIKVLEPILEEVDDLTEELPTTTEEPEEEIGTETDIDF